MAALDDLAAFYDVANGEGEWVVVNGNTVAAIFDTAGQALVGEAVIQAPVLRCPRTVSAPEGCGCTVRSVAYVVRHVVPINTDEHQLVLVKA